MTVMCDLCSDVVDSCWTYTTKNVATSEQDCLNGGGFWAEDPEWAVCTTCHRIIQEGSGAELFEYAFRLQCLKVKKNPLSNSPEVAAAREFLATNIIALLEFPDPDRPPYFEKDAQLRS